MKRYALLALFAVALPVLAQKIAASAPPPDAPKMTEHQQDRLDLCLSKMAEINTRHQAQVAQETASWVKEASDIIDAVQKENPDFVYHVAQGPQDRTGWMRKPPPHSVVPPQEIPPKPTPQPPDPAKK
jgi:hypothetical protein